MFTSLFILSFTCYLLSVALALAGSIFSSKISEKYINFIIIIHLALFGICVFFFDRIGPVENPSMYNYIFLIFFCLGIVTSGIIIRIGYPLYLKLYFFLFLISIPIFIVSPSRVLGFIVTGDIHAIHRNRIHIKDNYFLVAQTKHQKDYSQSVRYKLTREMGLFYRTLQRDIMIPGLCDSIRVISEQQDSIRLRFFFSKDYINDSIDQTISLKPVRDSSRIITRQPQIIQ